MPVIELRDIKKSFVNEGVETSVLHGISFDIHKGEFVAIMGPSGSGKSTLLHILGFLDRHTSGEYRFDGKTIDDYSPDEVAHIRNKKMGFVFQAFNLLARATVLENVKLPFLYSDIPEREWDERALRAIASVGLSHREQHEAARLSGGERQRAAIARALALNPEVVFADEPTGNLDSKSGQGVMEILQRLNQEEGRTIILITHETYTAEHAGRILFIKDGLVERDQKVERRKDAHTFIK